MIPWYTLIPAVLVSLLAGYIIARERVRRYVQRYNAHS
jgi:hypothetical protein